MVVKARGSEGRQRRDWSATSVRVDSQLGLGRVVHIWHIPTVRTSFIRDELSKASRDHFSMEIE